MEINEGNIKPQQTGGLKLMTVFIAVLALHVVVIGGFTVYHLLSASGSDPDLALDKNHKGAKALADGSLAGDLPATDAASTDKIAAPASTTPADLANTQAPDASPATSSAVTTTTPTTAPLAPVADSDNTVISPTSQTPSGPIQHGPVISPPENLTPSTTPVVLDSSAITPPSTSAPSDGDTAASATEGAPYVVKKGDSLARIAHQHHIALARLKAANSVSSDRLRIGHKLVIPSREQAVAATITTPTAPASTGADMVSAPADVTAPPAPAPHSAAKSAGHHLYTVVKGDTLIKIARRYHTTTSALMTANNLSDAGRLSIGRKLRIPSGESRSAAASAPSPTPAEQPEAKSGPKGQLANYVP